MKKYNIFIGHDERETTAWEVCKHSILKYTDEEEVGIYPLDHRVLRGLELFDRTWKITKDGNYLDSRDKRPFSTQFSHSRFLTPHYAEFLGCKGLVMFVDPDFLFNDDVRKLFKVAEDNDQMVHCVKHDFKTETTIKMDNRSQKQYPYKLWSSLMIYDMKYLPALKNLMSVENANHFAGFHMHTFKWLTPEGPVNDLVGELPEAWNFIPGHSNERVEEDDIMAVHYTEQSPWFKGQEHCGYANWWWEEYEEYITDTLLPMVKGYTDETS